VKADARIRPTRNHGSALIVTMLVTLLLGFTLASYLMLVRSQHASTARSQAWHQALVLAETGVEEALAQLNPGAFTADVANGNGWTLSGGFFQPDSPERTVLGGSYAVVYTPDNPPTIYSTGYTTIPFGSVTLSRVVCVTTTNAPLYATGLSVGRITNPTGHSYYQDSYDSENPAFSDNEHYNPAKARTAATLNPPSIMRTELPEVLPPFAIGLTLPTRIASTYSLSGNYLVEGNFHLAGSDKIYVSPGRTAVLYVTGDFSMSTDAELEIAQTGTLKLFVAGHRATIDYINNHGAPRNFQYYGLPGNTNVTLTQITPALVGSIYAPQASFAANNDTSLFNYSGSLVVNNLVLSRPFKFHFDESLARSAGPRRGFVVTSWQEL
jgi:Tfp pilus assembly protein PilX